MKRVIEENFDVNERDILPRASLYVLAQNLEDVADATERMNLVNSFYKSKKPDGP